MNKARWLEAAELSCGPSIGSQTWQTGISFVPGTFRRAKMLRRVYRAYQIRVRYQPRNRQGDRSDDPRQLCSIVLATADEVIK